MMLKKQMRAGICFLIMQSYQKNNFKIAFNTLQISENNLNASSILCNIL